MGSDHDAVSRRMRPGAWDATGFLGPDEVLGDRIDADLAICAELDTTPEAIGARLLDLLAEADGESDGAGDGGYDRFDEAAATHRRITIRPGDGHAVTCPWALELDEVCLRGPGGAPTADGFTIALGDRSLEGHLLTAHLVAVHRFFGGIESRFRIDPVQAVALLDPDWSGSPG